jgi:carbamoyl-phosphate synthase small subunit
LIISESATQQSSVAHKKTISATLALEDGRTFTGVGFGATGTAVGELVFNTSIIGYQEILTDPSYAGQIITLTYPEIGNYGTNDEDVESRRIFARGLAVKHLSRRYSSRRAEASLDDFLRKFNIVGIAEIDTRAITRHIRDKGAMRCAISNEGKTTQELIEIAVKSQSMEGLDLTGEVTTEKPYVRGNGKRNVAVLDYGIKSNIINQLISHDITAHVFPSSTKTDEILKIKPDGIFLSNGPGDPAACKDIIVEVKKMIDSKVPIFGICLGHQLLSLAMGCSTYKLKFGHRGGNQPVKDLTTGKVEITCQNHGFAVDDKSIPASMELTHINLNDQSVEGFRHKTLPIFAVQYHPEASPGPHDSNYLFQRFSDLMDGK